MGRPQGSPNKRSGAMADRLAEWGCNPAKILADIATNNMQCGVCRGKLRTKFILAKGKHAEECEGSANCTCDGMSERGCQSCNGTGMEACCVKDRKDAAGELIQYIEAKRKAVEVSGPEGGEIPMRLTVRFTGAPEPRVIGNMPQGD